MVFGVLAMKKKGVVDFVEAAEKLKHARAEKKLESMQDAFREARGEKNKEDKKKQKNNKKRKKQKEIVFKLILR